MGYRRHDGNCAAPVAGPGSARPLEPPTLCWPIVWLRLALWSMAHAGGIGATLGRTSVRRCAVALLLVAAVAGCDSAGPAEPSWRTPAASAPTRDKSPDSAVAGPSGILTTSLGMDPQATTTKLTIHDVQTGRPVVTGSMPGWPLRTRLHRQSFSPDWSLLAWDTNCEVRLAKKAADGHYRQVGTWRPPGWTPGGGGTLCYWAPRFVDGRVWLVVGGAGAGRVASFDPAVPGSQPREEHAEAEKETATLDGQGRPAIRMEVAMSGTEQSASTLVASERALVSAEVRVSADTAEASIFYACQEPVDDQTLLCVAQGGGQVYGAVALLTADREAKTVTLRQGTPKVAGGLRGAYLAPDRKRVAIHADGGWYLAALGSAEEPRPLFSQLATQGADVQFWG